MGTMVGKDGANKIGVAPKAKWIAAKGCESNSCSVNALLSSGQFILAPTRTGRNHAEAGAASRRREQLVGRAARATRSTSPR